MTAESLRKTQILADHKEDFVRIERELEVYAIKNPKVKHKTILIPTSKDINIYREYFESKGFSYSFVNNYCFNLSW